MYLYDAKMQMLLLKEPHTSHSTAVIMTASVVFSHIIHNENNTNSFTVSLLQATAPQSSGQTISPSRSSAKSFSTKYFDCPPPALPLMLNAHVSSFHFFCGVDIVKIADLTKLGFTEQPVGKRILF